MLLTAPPETPCGILCGLSEASLHAQVLCDEYLRTVLHPVGTQCCRARCSVRTYFAGSYCKDRPDTGVSELLLHCQWRSLGQGACEVGQSAAWVTWVVLARHGRGLVSGAIPG